MHASLAYAEPWKPAHGLPPWLHREAAGKAQGGPADASVGLIMALDPRPNAGKMPWFWNDKMNEWQARHVLAPDTAKAQAAGLPSGQNTLEGMASLWYGSGAPLLVEQIASVPQNAAIVGPGSHTDFFDFDVLLVPGLAQPPLPPPPGMIGKGGESVPGEEIPGLGEVIPGLGTIGEATPGFFPGGDMVPVSTGGAVSATTKEEPFWTPGKVAVAAGAGGLALIGIVYFATRPKRRRNPRRRRNWTKRSS